MFKCLLLNKLPILTLSITLFYVSTVLGQGNYIPGFIIQNNGDTVRGKIKYQETDIMHKEIFFKNGSSEVMYKPNDILEFGFDESYKFKSSATFPENELEENRFYRYLIRASSSILYDKKHNEFVFLNDSSFYSLNADKGTAKKVLKFWGVFAYYFQECIHLKKNPRLTEYKVKELAEEYYKCTGEPYEVFKKVDPKTKFSIGGIGGVMISNAKFKSKKDFLSEYSYIDQQTLYSNPTFIAGLKLEIWRPLVDENISLLVEMRYSTLDFNGDFVFGNSFNEVTFSYDQISIPILVKKKFGRLNTYVAFGWNSILRINSQSHWIKEEFFKFAPYIKTFSEEPFKMNTYRPGISAAIGQQINLGKSHLDVEFRFDRTLDAKEIDGLWSYSIMYQLQVSLPLVKI